MHINNQTVILILAVEKDEDVERYLRMLDEVMDKWSMQINWKKTKVLKLNGEVIDVT